MLTPSDFPNQTQSMCEESAAGELHSKIMSLSHTFDFVALSFRCLILIIWTGSLFRLCDRHFGLVASFLSIFAIVVLALPLSCQVRYFLLPAKKGWLLRPFKGPLWCPANFPLSMKELSISQSFTSASGKTA
jgi:hypothetical protein